MPLVPTCYTVALGGARGSQRLFCPCIFLLKYFVLKTFLCSSLNVLCLLTEGSDFLSLYWEGVGNIQGVHLEYDLALQTFEILGGKTILLSRSGHLFLVSVQCLWNFCSIRSKASYRSFWEVKSSVWESWTCHRSSLTLLSGSVHPAAIPPPHS